jgi:SnoaL-like domain
MSKESRHMAVPDLTPLTEQIRELSDRQAIADLITRLGRMLDDKSFEETESILADEVTVQTPGGRARGRDAVVAQARRNHTVRTQHVITNILIELEQDYARASANLVATFAPGEPESQLTINGAEQAAQCLTLGSRYHFEAARGASGWRLTSIEVAPVWSSGGRPPGSGGRVAQTDAAVPDAA